MRITRINIKRFGIIREFELETGGKPVTIIYGNNESGKTTILDAILEALFSVKKLKSHFEGIDRYTVLDAKEGPGSPDNQDAPFKKTNVLFEGAIELDINNSLLTFPQKESLDKVISIPPIYARNVFVVREGELDFNRSENWWSTVKNRLSGVSADYVKVTNKIRDIVGLTTKGGWMNRLDRPIADEMARLHNTLEEIKSLKEEIKELSKLSQQQLEVEDSLKKAQKKMDNLKKAQKKMNYLEGKRLVEKYNETRKKSLEYEKYKEDGLKTWRNMEMEVVNARQTIELSIKHRDNYLRQITEKHKDIEAWQRQIATWEKKEVEIIPGMETRLMAYKRDESRLQMGTAGRSLLPVWMILCAISFCTMIFISLKINPVFYAVAGILFIAFCYSITVLWSSKNIGSRLKSAEREILDTFKRISEVSNGYNNITINEVSDWLFKNRSIRQELKGQIKMVTEKDIPGLDNTAKELSLSIIALEKKLQKLESFTDAMKLNTGCSSWEEMQTKCNEKESLHFSLKMLAERINGLLNTGWEEEWEERLSELEPFASIELEWDEDLNRQLEEKIAQLDSQLKVINNKIIELRMKLAKLGIKTPEEVWLKEDEIQESLSQLETEKEAGLLAIEIIEKISQEQDKLINDVISDGIYSATHLFSTITNQRYKRVFLDKNDINICTANGRTLPANCLSTGAQAQLYFALRISLAQNLLQQRSAFLLLDDPFLSCDSARLKEMVNILTDITQKGWQLIYFTIDENIVSMFEYYLKDALNIYQLHSIND